MSGVRADPETSHASIVVEDARVVTPDAVVRGGVRVEGDRIAAVGDVSAAGDETRIDAAGRYVLPGLIDLHGDDIESHLHPRSNTRIETPRALATADRANVSAGVTTKFHAIAFKDEPEKNRSPALANELTEAIRGSDRLLSDHRIHARCEVTDPECVSVVEEVLSAGAVDLVSVMAHIPGKGQFRDTERWLSYYENHDRLTLDDAHRMLEERTGIDPEVLSSRIDAVVGRAMDAGVAVASHDDEDPVEVERLHERGVDISEYPVTMDAARRATELEMTTAMGAPNLVSGGSQWGNLGSGEAIEAGLVDVLCADYHPPSMLWAPFVETGEPLPERVARVTANPADAVGFDDRGRIEEGERADLIVVATDPTPVVEHVVVGGRSVYRTEGRR